jgi:sugar transferase (PEP-CTERM/EpsH1 system associated)
MDEILFLAHRIPFPPNRGDKMRSWNVLRHLGAHAKVHLAAFADDAEDAAHLGALREAMNGSLGEALVEPLVRNRMAWAGRALLRREPITVAAYHSPAVHAFVRRILAERPIASIYAFSVQMAQFIPLAGAPRFVMDFVDFDSAKYADYASGGEWPRRWLNKREAATLRVLERATAERADVGLFVSRAEAELFEQSARPAGGDIRALPNGIDLDHYDEQGDFAPLPDPPAGPLLVFTGQMNYRPNVEAMVDFAANVLPLVRAARSDVRLAIVGRHPAPAIAALAGRDGTIVTGEVADVRPWLAASALVVAPLAIARGVQNKVLEAMAMGRPVVASPGAWLGIDAEPGRDLIVADGARAQADAILSLLNDPDRAAAIGKAARLRMEEGYSWDAQLAPLAAMLGLAA